MTRRLLTITAIAFVSWLGLALPASAHPLGNFSVNVYNGVVVASDEVWIDHVIDLAEIPTVQAMPQLDGNGDESVSDTELAGFADVRCGEVSDRLRLSVAGAPAALSVTSATAVLADGQAGLATMRVECGLAADVTLSGSEGVSFRDESAATDLGWHEVTLRGDGVTVTDSDVPTTSASGALTSYPETQLESPLRVSSASAQVTPGGVDLVGTTEGNDSESTAVSEPGLWGWGTEVLGSVTATASGPVGMTIAMLVAVAVGAMHALAPGHGKSLVAFALAGRQQRAGRAALTVGATVTITHTASVLVLGLVVAGSAAIVPSSVYSVLGGVTGGVVVVLGLVLLWGSLRGDGHSHGPGGHSHGPGGHSPDEPVHRHPQTARAGSAVAVLEERPGAESGPSRCPNLPRGEAAGCW